MVICFATWPTSPPHVHGKGQEGDDEGGTARDDRVRDGDEHSRPRRAEFGVAQRRDLGVPVDQRARSSQPTKTFK